MSLIGRQSGSVTFGSSSTSATATVATYTASRCILLFTFTGANTTASNSSIRGAKTNSTTLTFTRSASGSTTPTVKWELLMFDSSVTVQDFTVTTGGTVATTITSVNLAKSFVVSLGQTTSNSSYTESCTVRWSLTGATTLTSFTGSSTSPGTAGCQVVQYNNCSVQAFTPTSKTAASWTQTITAVNPAQTVIFASGSPSGAITWTARDVYRLFLTNSTTVTATRNASPTTSWNVAFFVVTFTDNTTVQQALQTLSATSTNVTVTPQPTTVASYLNCGCSSFGLGHGYSDSATSPCDMRELMSAVSQTDIKTLNFAKATAASSAYVGWQLINWDETSQDVGAITYDNASSGSANATSLTFSHTIGSGSNRLLCVGISTTGNGTTDSDVTGVTYNGVAMTKAISVANTAIAGFNLQSTIFYMLEASLPATGAYSVVVSTTNALNISAGSTSLASVRQQAPEATASQGLNAQANNISTSISTLTDNAWIFDTASTDGVFTNTPGGSQVERFDVAGNISAAGSTLQTTTHGSYTMSWTFSGNANRRCHTLTSWAPLGTSTADMDAVTLGTNC